MLCTCGEESTIKILPNKNMPPSRKSTIREVKFFVSGVKGLGYKKFLYAVHKWQSLERVITMLVLTWQIIKLFWGTSQRIFSESGALNREGVSTDLTWYTNPSSAMEESSHSLIPLILAENLYEMHPTNFKKKISEWNRFLAPIPECCAFQNKFALTKNVL